MKKQKKLKICMLAHNPPFQGGIVQYCVLLENNLIKLYKDKLNMKIIGFNHLYPPLLYKGKLPKKNRSGINFQSPNSNFIDWFNPLSWIKAYFVMRKADIMYLHWVSPLLTPLQFVILKLNRIFSKKKVILTCHNIEPHESTVFDRIFTKTIFSLTDNFVIHAQQNKQRLIRDYNIHPDKICVAPHGSFGFFTRWRPTNLTKIHLKQQLRKEFNIDQKTKVILFFGYIREYKGLRYLLRAMHKIIEQEQNNKTENKVKLIIAGELWQNIKEYKKDLKGLKKYIQIYPKFIPDHEVHKYFDVSDICVLPYYNSEQTISGPLLISLAFGIPTIVSPVGGLPEFVKDNHEVIFSEGGNVDLLTKNILNLLRNKKLQLKLSKNALKKDKSFQWDNVALNYYNVFNNVGGRNDN